jgi:hypothetical protein
MAKKQSEHQHRWVIDGPLRRLSWRTNLGLVTQRCDCGATRQAMTSQRPPRSLADIAASADRRP